MSGKRYLLDTNAVIQLLKGNRNLADELSRASCIAISIICEFEFLSFPMMSEVDKMVYNAFRSRIQVFDLVSDDPMLRHNVLEARAAGLILPDAMIAGTARTKGMILLTADEHFKKLGEEWDVKYYDVDGTL